MLINNSKTRCSWVGSNNSIDEQYHDEQWGKPVHDDQRHFEMLILEGAQAGLSWITILKRRDGYRQVFYNFDVKRVAAMTDDDLEKAMLDPRIIRNRLKVFSTRQNAKVFMEIQKEFGSFDQYVWQFYNKENSDKRMVTTKESDALSADLKRRGMKFVGSIIMQSFMQANGLIDDHQEGCWLYKK